MGHGLKIKRLKVRAENDGDRREVADEGRRNYLQIFKLSLSNLPKMVLHKTEQLCSRLSTSEIRKYFWLSLSELTEKQNTAQLT